jgi:signal transduction histidine kinase
VAEDAAQRLDVAVTPGQLVRGDAALLRQAIANLIENALTHGGPGVSVEVRVRAEPSPILSVRDNGPGIPASEHGRVLERFYRLDRSRNTPGSGLGLALVAAVARLHGATLRLEDAKPGLEVSMAFPAL